MCELSEQQILPGDSGVQFIHTLYEFHHMTEVAKNCSVYSMSISNTKCAFIHGYENLSQFLSINSILRINATAVM